MGEAAAAIVDALVTTGPRGAMIAEAAKAAGHENVFYFSSKAEAGAVLAESLDFGDVLLIKGSHGLALNTVVERLKLPEGDA